MGLTWLTTSETAGLLGITERAIQYQVEKGKFKTKAQIGPRGQGGKMHLIALESLPREVQRIYLNRFLDEIKADQTGAIEEISSQPEPETESPAADKQGDKKKITTIAELIAKYGQARADEILSKACDEWEAIVQKGLEIKNDREKNKTRRMKELAAQYGVNHSTLYRKCDRYTKKGILGLVDDRYLAPGEGLEGKMRRAICDEGIRWIKAMCLQSPPPTTTHIYKELKRVAPARGWNLPSQATVYRIINDISKAEIIMGQRGQREYEATMMPKIKRDYSHLLFMQEIVGDGHIFDLFVEWQGRAIRPQLSLWQDMRTRKIVGWCIAPQANSDTIAIALRHAIITTSGLPGCLYTDNGKDYLSKYLEQVCRDLHIDTRHCIPKNPRAKMVERLFKTVHDQFTKYLVGYCGNKAENRPEGFDEKKLLKQKKLMTMERFVTAWEAYVEEYNNQVHRALGDTPENVSRQVPHVNPGQVDIRDLDILLMRREGVRVNDGYITFMGRNYWSHNIDLGRLVGERVQLWYDPSRIGEVLIWYKSKFIGTAVNQKALAHGEDRAALAAELKANRQAGKAVKQQIAAYSEGLEDILPEEVVKKAKRSKRYYSGNAEGQSPGQDIPRMTGQEKVTRQARQVLNKARKQDAGSAPPRKYTRAEKMLLERGDRMLASN